MIRFSMLALAVMSFCFGTPVLKAEGDAPKANAKVEVVEGVVEKAVDAKGDSAEKAVFVLKVGDKLVEVTVLKDTKYINVDGKEVKVEEVVVKGAKVKVTHTDCKAAKVEACKAAAAK